MKKVGLVASASWISGCAAPRMEKGKPGGVHRLVSANIRVPLEVDEKTGDGWDARKELCAEVLNRQGADIIGLQECHGHQLEFLKEKMPRHESFGLLHPGPDRRPGNAILFLRSRYRLLTAGGFWLSEKPHVAGSLSWDSAVPRFANWIELEDLASGKVFRVWNTHFDHKGHVARENQARVLCEGAEAAHPGEFPQLLIGDLNANLRHPAIAVIKEHGWKDTYSAVHGTENPGFTFHRFLGPKYQEVAKPEAAKIDWIFSRGAVEALASEVIRDGRNGKFPSDHYFISADVRI